MAFIFGGIVAAIVIFLVVDVLYYAFSAPRVPVPNISREPRSFGTTGEPLTFAIFGDSRVVGQGGEYEAGIAVTAAKHLATSRKVTLYNYGVSGARTNDVLTKQIPQISTKPDVAVLLIGANDITHRTNQREVVSDLDASIQALLAQNCNMKIVVADAGAMWAVWRIPHPFRYLAGKSSKRLSAQFESVVSKYQLTSAPIGADTGAAFVHDRSNLAADHFHPSTKGYTLLGNALLPYLDKAIATQQPRC